MRLNLVNSQSEIWLVVFDGCSRFLNMQMNVSASVGVIGGADGPTSIFFAGEIGTPWGLYIATAVVIIATIIYIVKKHKKG